MTAKELRKDYTNSFYFNQQYTVDSVKKNTAQLNIEIKVQNNNLVRQLINQEIKELELLNRVLKRKYPECYI